MIPRISGWTRVEQRDLVILTHADGPGAGVVCYCERLRPMRPVDRLLAEALTDARALPDAPITPPERIRTEEGELAAFGTATARRDGPPLALAIGVVLGDDFCALVEGRATQPDHFARLADTVRTLVRRDVLALGRRRRRLLLRGPRGWRARDRGLATDWVAPASDAVIRVFPAEPCVGDSDPIATLVAATASAGVQLDELDGPYDLPADAAMRATTWRLCGRTTGLHCDLAVVRDDAYEYAAVLESRDEAVQARHRAALHDVVAAIAPLAPRARAARDAATQLFAHWSA